jgi:putative Mg2+ transporter-C (MgtC) family protein
MDFLTEDVIKILLAILVGGLIGAEREYRDKAAGFRTIIFICLGATLYTMFSLKIGGEEDPVRIAANVVSGVGFLGAGAILRGAGGIVGLTTAATIWLAAAFGVGIGGGEFLFAAVAAIMVLLILMVFPRLEAWIDNLRNAVTYEVVIPVADELFEQLNTIFLECGLSVRDIKRTKSGQNMRCTFQVDGTPQCHDHLVSKLMAHPEVLEFQI